MKKIKMIILLLILVNNLKAELLNFDLVQFANYTANQNSISILIDDELKENIFSFSVASDSDYSLEAFRSALGLKDLQLVMTKDFYYVRKKVIYIEDLKYRSIKLNFVKYEDISNFLKVYNEFIKYEFISTSKTLLVYSKEKEFNSIFQMIKSIDILPKQLKLKVSIIDTNLDKLKQLGSDSSQINLQNNGNFFFNLVSYPFSVNNNVPLSQKDNFYTFLKYLNTKNISEFVSNPVLTLSDEKETVFNVVSNVPYNVGSTTIDETVTRTSNSYQYKDVGLQITVTPHIYSDNNVYLDLELNVSNIQSNVDNLPVTNSKYIKQSFHLPVNSLLVLTGINKKEINNSYSEIPLLADIPFLGWLFKYDSKQELKTNLSVVFELIEEENYQDNSFAVVIPNSLENQVKLD